MKKKNIRLVLIACAILMCTAQSQAQSTKDELDALTSTELIQDKSFGDLLIESDTLTSTKLIEDKIFNEFLIEHEKGNQLAIIDAMVRFILSPEQLSKLNTAENKNCHDILYDYMISPQVVAKHTIDTMKKEEGFSAMHVYLDGFIPYLKTEDGRLFINEQKSVMITWLVANENGKFTVNPLAKKFKADFYVFGFLPMNNKHTRIRNDFDWASLYEDWYARLDDKECRNVFKPS